MYSFLGKVQRLALVLNKMERVFDQKGGRQTNFEILDADKKNPTTLTLKPVPTVYGYNPKPAFWWGLTQLSRVAKGEEPDSRLSSDIANDLVKLATKEEGYKAFWVNGHFEPVRFDETFLANATTLARNLAHKESPLGWRVGKTLGTVVGKLEKIDDYERDREFVIVPLTNADAITCVFPEDMREKMGAFVFKTVRVEGLLYYGELSPFPYRVDALPDGLKVFLAQDGRKSLSDLRGAFAGTSKPEVDWDSLIDA